MCARDSWQAARAASHQSRRPTSSHSVPDASEQSVANSPVSCSRNQSLGSSTCVVRAKICGSCSRTQSSFGAVNPGIARLPATRCSAGNAASSAVHSAPLRPSFHSIAGRSTASCASSSTAPCICPDSPIARTAASERGCSACSCCMPSSSACHQSCGACSLHSGCGRDTVSGCAAVARTRCVSSSSSSLSSEVPRSMPRYMLVASLQRVRPKRRSACCLYSDGVMPLISRKRRLKLATFWKPTS